MRDIELYRALVGLAAPWAVAGVDVDLNGQRVVVRVEAGPGPDSCPECGTSAPRYDSKPRRWRHLDTIQFTTWIEADVLRVKCGTHGVKQLRVPRVEPDSQVTAPFERLAIHQVPRGEHRALRRAGDDRLTGSKVLVAPTARGDAAEPRSGFRALLREGLRVGRAWVLKERFAPSGSTATSERRKPSSHVGTGPPPTAAGSSQWWPSPS
jgi:hypothetical protein